MIWNKEKEINIYLMSCLDCQLQLYSFKTFIIQLMIWKMWM